MKNVLVVMVGLAMLVGTASADTILIDFGGNYATGSEVPTPDVGWNNVAGDPIPDGFTITDMVDSNGVATDVDLSTTAWRNSLGGALPNTSGYPDTASGDNAVCMDKPDSPVEAWVTISDLDNNMLYEFTYYASLSGGAYINVDYTATAGVVSDTQTLNIVDNTSETAISALMTPVNGTVVINVKGTPSGDDWGLARAALGVLEINEVPEPATMSLLALGGLAALIRRKR